MQKTTNKTCGKCYAYFAPELGREPEQERIQSRFGNGLEADTVDHVTGHVVAVDEQVVPADRCHVRRQVGFAGHLVLEQGSAGLHEII